MSEYEPVAYVCTWLADGRMTLAWNDGSVSSLVESGKCTATPLVYPPSAATVARPTPALYRFTFAAVPSDPTGYYFTRWDRAKPITVVAADVPAAQQKARTALGEAPNHWTWALRLDKTEEVTP